MRKIYKSIHFLFIAIAILGAFASCNNEDVKSGAPVISYIRITKPAASDSLLAAAGQGQMIAIIGNNLQDTRQIWFNDQQASLTPTYISNKSILVNVPSHIPMTVDNKLKLIFANGDSLLYNFSVTVNKPTITSMDCEYVLDGGIATIHGNYFYLPISVTFPGGIAGINPSVDATNQILTVTVPQGVSPGQITVTTNFGETKSDFWFRDNRNLFVTWDPFPADAWSGSQYVVTNPGPTDPPAINGNYCRVKQSIGVWAWTDFYDGDMTTAIPDAAILNPASYNLKFELCTTKPYNNNNILFGIGKPTFDNQHCYKFSPPIDTKGQWQTIVIPFEDIMNTSVTPNVVSPTGYITSLIYLGGTALDCDMSYDNFRVVPKIIKP
ncbi:MAG: glycan-binding surface protein [Paludibacter sp.]|nr:glycan-binding surface protein [Paludibacter sp.]